MTDILMQRQINQTRVNAGAAWLDDNYPGWEDKVNTDNLSMLTNCILMQVIEPTASENGFSQIHRAMGPQFVVDHGFVVDGRDEWIELIDARRMAMAEAA